MREVQIRISAYFVPSFRPIASNANRCNGLQPSQSDFRVANQREPVFIKTNNKERQTVLRKGH
jgi:hypothetical protein